MNYISEIGLLISIITLFFVGLTKNEKYTLKKIKKISVIVAVLLLIIWVFHDIPEILNSFNEGWDSGYNMK